MVIGGVAGAPLAVLLGVAAALAILLPMFGYPITYTVWFGVDLAMHTPESGDLEHAQARRSEHATK